jgi:hypothetical protein
MVDTVIDFQVMVAMGVSDLSAVTIISTISQNKVVFHWSWNLTVFPPIELHPNLS